MSTAPDTTATERAAGTAPTAGTPQDAPDAADAPALRIHCRADAAGTLTFALPAAAAGPRPVRLLLRRRNAEPPQEVLLPLVPDGDGQLTTTLDAGAPLAEGRWDAFLAPADGTEEPRRPALGVNDLRTLADRASGHVDAPVAVRLPYATRQGDLAIRSWLRAAHAEAGDLHVAADALTVHGRVHGTELTPRACVELRGRTGARPLLRVPVRTEGADFTGTVTYRELVDDEATQEFWDLWLRPEGADGPRVRIARLLDDVADKKPVFTFPARRVPGRAASGGSVEVRPYYTVDNDLAVRIDPVPDGDPT